MKLSDLKTKLVDKEFAKRFISKYHYSKTCSNIVVAIGQWYGLDLINCIVFNYCSGREMAKQVMRGGDNDNTLELSRMVSIEPKPKNLESYAISKAFEWLKENMPNIKLIISYADNTMHHKGYCYQASNFVYYGQSRPTKEFYLDGERIYERVLNTRFGTSSCNKLKEILGDRLIVKQNNESKSRYYHLLYKTKLEKKKLERKIIVQSFPYPKGDNKRYDMSVNGNFHSLDKSKANEETKINLSRQLNIFDF